jgi:predicted RNA-binding protein with PUA-like domain
VSLVGISARRIVQKPRDSISAAMHMPRPERGNGSCLLHAYDLRSKQTQRVRARSQEHETAFIRLKQTDIEMLAGLHTRTSQPITALFYTQSTREPVRLGIDETIFVSLPDTARQEPRSAKEAPRSAKEAPRSAKEAPRSAKEAPRSAKEAPRSAKEAPQEAWLPLRLVAHHAYVSGMRVSGTMHRAIVRLTRE